MGNETDLDLDPRDDGAQDADDTVTRGRRRPLVIAGVAIALALGGAALALSGKPPAGVPQGSQDASSATLGENGLLAVTEDIVADGWGAGSSPFVARVSGRTELGDEVDFHHAFYPADAGTALELAPGTYKLDWLAAVNPDGSTYSTDGVATDLGVVPGEPPVVSVRFDTVPATDVTMERFESAMGALEAAVASGDETLSGDAGERVVALFTSNYAAAPALDEKEVEKAGEHAGSAVAEKPAVSTTPNAGKPAGDGRKPSAPAGTVKPSKPSGDGGAKPDGGAPSVKPPAAHKHTWVDVTEQRWVANNVWVVDQAAWDEVIPGKAYVLCSCGARFGNSREWGAHAEAEALNGSFDHSYTVLNEPDTTIHHDEVGHYEDRGRYETVVVGRKCSGCGQKG